MLQQTNKQTNKQTNNISDNSEPLLRLGDPPLFFLVMWVPLFALCALFACLFVLFVCLLYGSLFVFVFVCCFACVIDGEVVFTGTGSLHSDLIM